MSILLIDLPDDMIIYIVSLVDCTTLTSFIKTCSRYKKLIPPCCIKYIGRKHLGCNAIIKSCIEHKFPVDNYQVMKIFHNIDFKDKKQKILKFDNEDQMKLAKKYIKFTDYKLFTKNLIREEGVGGVGENIHKYSIIIIHKNNCLCCGKTHNFRPILMRTILGTVTI